ncbi:MAG: helix-turn-helix transcriptional regulator [Burkholderiales bacterium]
MFASTRTASVASGEDAPASSNGDSLLALAVDTLRQGLILFDESGYVVGANATARRTVAQHADLEFAASPEPPHDRMRLQVRRSALQLKLERALRACASTGSGPGSLTLQAALSREPRPSQALVLTFDHGQPGLILQLSAMPSPARGDAGQPVVLGVLIDRSSPASLEPAMLRDLFGLTEAESRVAEAYLRVDTVKDVAQLLGVSANTVKTHLASVYLKTGCTRQAQLVRLLMSLSEASDEPVSQRRT